MGVNVGTNPHICVLISSFYTDRSRLVEPNFVPHWDLTVVLNAFTKSPFEPRDMASVELKFLTLNFKTVFLVFGLWGPDEVKSRFRLVSHKMVI